MRDKRRRKKPPKLPPSDDDVWLDDLHTECGRAMAQWLKASLNLERQIKTLTLTEMKGLAAAAEAAWIAAVCRRLVRAEPPLSDEETTRYRALLMG